APVRYLGLQNAPAEDIDPNDLFAAMTEDLLRDGDVDLAMQKAFRWGYEDAEGNHQEGLRDIMQRLRDDREELLDQAADEAAGDAPAPDAFSAENDAGADDDSAQRAEQMQQMERSLRAIENLDELQDIDPDLADTVLTDAERSWLDQWANMSGTLIAEGLVIEAGDRLD